MSHNRAQYFSVYNNSVRISSDTSYVYRMGLSAMLILLQLFRRINFCEFRIVLGSAPVEKFIVAVLFVCVRRRQSDVQKRQLLSHIMYCLATLMYNLVWFNFRLVFLSTSAHSQQQTLRVALAAAALQAATE